MSSPDLSTQFEQKILEEAIQSPATAMMRLSLEIDRQLRLILAAIGRLKEYSGESPTEALDIIARGIDRKNIPSALQETLRSFWDLRNEVVHGGGSRERFAMRALDYGLRILRMLQSIPRPSFIVVSVVPIFSDPACQHMRGDARGVILAHLGPNGEDYGRHIHPSRRVYVDGQSVAWEWDLSGKVWDETWYRDPESNEVKPAWGGSLEFVGRPLDEI
jgi:hypothetical protein